MPVAGKPSGPGPRAALSAWPAEKALALHPAAGVMSVTGFFGLCGAAGAAGGGGGAAVVVGVFGSVIVFGNSGTRCG